MNVGNIYGGVFIDLETLNETWNKLNIKECKLNAAISKLNSKLSLLDQQRSELSTVAHRSGYVYDFDEWVKEEDRQKNPLLGLERGEIIRVLEEVVPDKLDRSGEIRYE